MFFSGKRWILHARNDKLCQKLPSHNLSKPTFIASPRCNLFQKAFPFKNGNPFRQMSPATGSHVRRLYLQAKFRHAWQNFFLLLRKIEPNRPRLPHFRRVLLSKRLWLGRGGGGGGAAYKSLEKIANRLRSVSRPSFSLSEWTNARGKEGSAWKNEAV